MPTPCAPNQKDTLDTNKGRSTTNKGRTMNTSISDTKEGMQDTTDTEDTKDTTERIKDTKRRRCALRVCKARPADEGKGVLGVTRLAMTTA